MRVTIMSGPPGSGKSYYTTETLIPHLRRGGESGRLLSADHYFQGLKEDYCGLWFPWKPHEEPVLEPYEFINDEIHLAHAQCGKAFLDAFQEGVDNIIVDNTNIWIGERAPYYAAAQWFGADVVIKRLNTPLHICLERNTHKVPRKIVEAMWHVHHMRNDQGYLREELPWWNVEHID